MSTFRLPLFPRRAGYFDAVFAAAKLAQSQLPLFPRRAGYFDLRRCGLKPRRLLLPLFPRRAGYFDERVEASIIEKQANSRCFPGGPGSFATTEATERKRLIEPPAVSPAGRGLSPWCRVVETIRRPDSRCFPGGPGSFASL